MLLKKKRCLNITEDREISSDSDREDSDVENSNEENSDEEIFCRKLIIKCV